VTLGELLVLEGVAAHALGAGLVELAPVLRRHADGVHGAPSRTVAPCTMAPCPTPTFSPMIVGTPVSVWTTQLSCRLLPAPSTISSRSPRSTAP
jgi:hypothetical protein